MQTQSRAELQNFASELKDESFPLYDEDPNLITHGVNTSCRTLGLTVRLIRITGGKHLRMLMSW